MTIMENVSNIQFRIETLVVRDGHKLGRMRPDNNGYYAGMPIAVLGITTRNNTYYDIQTFQQQITDKNSSFNTVLSTGGLYGEWGHPDIKGMREDLALLRLCEIKEQNYSHHFKSIYTGEKLNNGGLLLLADVKPTGPYKQSLEDNLNDPFMNTAFSLRAITSAENKGNISYRRMKKLVTFDAVGCSGYAESTKLYAKNTSMESFDSFDMSIVDIDRAVFNQTALEHFTDTELNDIFGTDKIYLEKKIISVVTTEDPDGFTNITSRALKSHFHEMLKG